MRESLNKPIGIVHISKHKIQRISEIETVTKKKIELYTMESWTVHGLTYFLVSDQITKHYSFLWSFLGHVDNIQYTSVYKRKINKHIKIARRIFFYEERRENIYPIISCCSKVLQIRLDLESEHLRTVQITMVRLIKSLRTKEDHLLDIIIEKIQIKIQSARPIRGTFYLQTK